MDVRVKETTLLTNDEYRQIDQLWNELYPVNLSKRFSTLLNDLREFVHYLMLSEADEIIGWAMTFLRDNEIWFSILISPNHQKQGYGKMLISRIKKDNQSLTGWVIDHNNDFKSDGSPYINPIPFYLRNDFKVTNIRLETDIISAVKIKWQD